MTDKELQRSIEALMFISGDGLAPKDIADGLNQSSQRIKAALNVLVEEYIQKAGGIYIESKGGKYQFKTAPSIFEHIQLFLKEKKKETLSRAMLEVLAIVAYRQPITQFELDELRGVKSRSIVTALVSKKLVKIMGQKETAGRPTIYGTSREFLEYFGLKSLRDLPELKELKELNFDELE